MSTWTIQPGQIGRVNILQTVPLYTLVNGTLSRTNKTVTKNDGPLPVFSSYNKTLSVKFGSVNKTVNKFYKTKIGVEFFWVPEFSGYTEYEAPPNNLLALTPTSNNTGSDTISDFIPLSEDVYEPNVYLRPVLQIKTADNKLVSIGLRLSGVQTSFSNQFMPNQTNAGWYVHSAGPQLATFSLNGFFLDTKTNQEFNSFMTRYQKYLKSYRDGDFYSSAICTFFFKGKQYKCLISSFSQSQNESEPLLSRFNMQLLILKERGFNNETNLSANPKTNVQVLNVPGGYYSSLSAMVINPIASYPDINA